MRREKPALLLSWDLEEARAVRSPASELEAVRHRFYRITIG
jgi:hypothetical protein